MPRRQQTSPFSLVLAAIVASGMMHVVLWPVGDRVLKLSFGTSPIPTASGVMQVSLLSPLVDDPARDPDDPDQVLEEEPEPPPDSTIVQQDRILDERAPDEPTKHLSEFDSRVDHETKAPTRRPQAGDAPQLDGRPAEQPNDAKPSPDPATKSLNLATRGATEAPQGHALDDGELAELARGEDQPQGSTPPPRAGFLGSPQAMQKTFGGAGTLDALEDVDEGTENLLNSKRYKYASFFNRVRNLVAQHWNPADVHRAHDPDMRIYGNKTRRTDLVIRLNPDGTLAGILRGRSCEVEHLDEEAIRAVRQAAPFDNPPAGLVDPQTGLIEFGFGFIFEIGGKARVFRYQR